MLILAAISLLVSLLTTGIGHGLPALASLGIYFDGHLYIDIAKSFPFPYDAGALDYLSHAPGYAGLIALGRLLTPDLVNWGVLAVLSTWGAAVAATLAFYLLCRELQVPALQASLTFLLANPAWTLVSSAPHSEPLAMAFVLLCFVAHLRGALGWSVTFLSLAMLTRYPAILLGAALAYDLLVAKRRFDLKTIAWLSAPLVVFGLYNLYLASRVPGFTNLIAVHQVHWEAGITVPFAAMVNYWQTAETGGLQFGVIFATAAFYTAMAIIGLRGSQKANAWLAVWVLVIHGFHISLSGQLGVVSFTRLALLAWPAALLIAWKIRPRALPVVALLTLCGVLGGTSIWISQRQIAVAVYFQSQRDWMRPKLHQIDGDEPRWFAFPKREENSDPEARSALDAQHEF